MIFKTILGSKNNNPKDKILLGKINGWEALKLKDWLIWARFKGRIEDLHYPLQKGLRGRMKLVDFLIDGLKKENNDEALPEEDYFYLINEVCKKHNIPEK